MTTTCYSMCGLGSKSPTPHSLMTLHQLHKSNCQKANNILTKQRQKHATSTILPARHTRHPKPQTSIQANSIQPTKLDQHQIRQSLMRPPLYLTRTSTSDHRDSNASHLALRLYPSSQSPTCCTYPIISIHPSCVPPRTVLCAPSRPMVYYAPPRQSVLR